MYLQKSIQTDKNIFETHGYIILLNCITNIFNRQLILLVINYKLYK